MHRCQGFVTVILIFSVRDWKGLSGSTKAVVQAFFMGWAHAKITSKTNNESNNTCVRLIQIDFVGMHGDALQQGQSTYKHGVLSIAGKSLDQPQELKLPSSKMGKNRRVANLPRRGGPTKNPAMNEVVAKTGTENGYGGQRDRKDNDLEPLLALYI